MAGWWQEAGVARAARKEPAATAASVPSCVYITLRIRSVSRYACLMSKPLARMCVCVRVCDVCVCVHSRVCVVPYDDMPNIYAKC